MTEAQIEMPRYKSHKEVWALKIESISTSEANPGMSYLVFEDEAFKNKVLGIELGNRMIDAWERYNGNGLPKDMGYYVVYADGYQSWSPSKAFEEGYTLIK